MGIDLWLKTCFVTQRPLILKVNVLNFKSIKVTRFAVKKSGKFANVIYECPLSEDNILRAAETYCLTSRRVFWGP